jgi:hypothetical protein
MNKNSLLRGLNINGNGIECQEKKPRVLLQVDLAKKIGVNEMTIVKLPAASCGASVTKSSGTPDKLRTMLGSSMP